MIVLENENALRIIIKNPILIWNTILVKKTLQKEPTLKINKQNHITFPFSQYPRPPEKLASGGNGTIDLVPPVIEETHRVEYNLAEKILGKMVDTSSASGGTKSAAVQQVIQDFERKLTSRFNK